MATEKGASDKGRKRGGKPTEKRESASFSRKAKPAAEKKGFKFKKPEKPAPVRAIKGISKSVVPEKTEEKKTYTKPFQKVVKKKLVSKPETFKEDDGYMRLNKFISNAGVCSRREADELIKVGAVSVNGKVVTEVGTKVHVSDKVQYGKETLKPEKNIYVLLNKPKDFVTTSDDPQNRRTVMELLKGVGKYRVYPVGRLDRMTMGVLLFTNDGELTQKLLHPKHLVKKIYHIELHRGIDADHFKMITDGITLEDGFIKPDALEYANKENKKELGIEIHSGRNRIVRRIFENFNYQVLKLDRVFFAGLTKKDLPRGKWRFLTENEVRTLKMLG